MKIIQISDLHISRHSGELKHNCTPYELLVSVLDNINTSHSDLSGLVITGDLSNDYTPESYQNIRSLLNSDLIIYVVPTLTLFILFFSFRIMFFKTPK